MRQRELSTKNYKANQISGSTKNVRPATFCHWPMHWTICMSAMWSIVTSNQRTCCLATMENWKSPISDGQSMSRTRHGQHFAVPSTICHQKVCTFAYFYTTSSGSRQHYSVFQYFILKLQWSKDIRTQNRSIYGVLASFALNYWSANLHFKRLHMKRPTRKSLMSTTVHRISYRRQLHIWYRNCWCRIQIDECI